MVAQVQCVSIHLVGIYCHFALSSMQPEFIALIVSYIHFSNLLDPAYFATKRPFYLRSSRCPFSECLYIRHFPKHALLDLPRSLMPQGKVHRNRGKSRHFPREELDYEARTWRSWGLYASSTVRGLLWPLRLQAGYTASGSGSWMRRPMSPGRPGCCGLISSADGKIDERGCSELPEQPLSVSQSK